MAQSSRARRRARLERERVERERERAEQEAMAFFYSCVKASKPRTRHRKPLRAFQATLNGRTTSQQDGEWNSIVQGGLPSLGKRN